jgi:multidrug resistance efflux pump
MKTKLALVSVTLAASAAFAEPATLTLVSPMKNESVVEFIAASNRAVQPGEALLVLDTGTILDELRETEGFRKAAAGELKSREDQVAPAEAAAAAAAAAAAYDATQAERAFNRYKEGEAPAGELMLKLALVEAQSVLDRQQERFNARDKLLADGYIQKNDYEKEAVLLTKAQYALEAAKLKLDSFVKYERDQTSEQLARILETKKQALSNTQAQGVKNVEAAKAAVEAARQKLKWIEAECERLKQLLKSTVLYAPAAGQFIVGDPVHPETKIEAGTPLRPGAVIGVLKKR